jgi:hypothetical protein
MVLRHPIILPLMREFPITFVPPKIVEFSIRTPGPIMHFAPITTLGPS